MTKKKQPEKTTSQVRTELGSLVAGSYYDYQQIRKQTMNRIRNIIYRKMENLDLNEVQERKPEEQKYLENYKDEFLDQYIRILYEEGEISEEERKYLDENLEVQKRARKQENDYKNLMKKFVEAEPIYQKFLSKIKGISQILSANLIKEIGYCEKAPHISSVWAFFGLHPVCPDCRKEVVNEKDGKKYKYHLVANYNGYCERCGKKGIAEKRVSGVRNNFSVQLRSIAFLISDSFV